MISDLSGVETLSLPKSLRVVRTYSSSRSDEETHAQLIDGTVVIETDNIEEGLTTALIEADIREEDIISGEAFDERRSQPIAA